MRFEETGGDGIGRGRTVSGRELTQVVSSPIVVEMIRLTEDQFGNLVERAIEDLPEEFQKYLRDVVIEVEDLPDRRTVRMMGRGSLRGLLGLYHGTPLTHRSVEHSGRLPDRIVLYKENIEDYCGSPEEIIEQVRKTVLHEVGHHFGLEEDELRSMGY
jgi:predicted Zn-dependent protease with MMP-like domain